MNSRIENLDFVIVGASHGIGAALATHFVSRGAHVLACSRNAETSEASLGLTQLSLDLASGRGMNELAERVTGQPVTVIVTAAVFGPPAGISATNKQDLAATLQTNVVGTFELLKQLSNSVSPQSHFVLFMGGGVGGDNLQENAVSYVISKMALAGLIESVGREWAASGPTLFGVSPGFYATGFSNVVDSDLGRFRKAEELNIDKLIELIDVLTGLPRNVTAGRYFSSQWDEPLHVEQLICDEPSFGRLRRLDNDLFGRNSD